MDKMGVFKKFPWLLNWIAYACLLNAGGVYTRMSIVHKTPEIHRLVDWLTVEGHTFTLFCCIGIIGIGICHRHPLLVGASVFNALANLIFLVMVLRLTW